LAQHVSEPEALAAGLEAAKAVLEGRAAGKLKQVSEKVGTLAAVTALASAPGRSRSLAELARSTADFLAAYYKEELNEEVRAHVVLDSCRV
jgi:hypothetical protein